MTTAEKGLVGVDGEWDEVLMANVLEWTCVPADRLVRIKLAAHHVPNWRGVQALAFRCLPQWSYAIVEAAGKSVLVYVPGKPGSNHECPLLS